APAGGAAIGNRTAPLRSRLALAGARIRQWRRTLRAADVVRIGTGIIGLFGALVVLRGDFSAPAPLPRIAAIAATLTLAAAGLAATVAGYLVDLDPAQLPEAPFLCRGARVVA